MDIHLKPGSYVVAVSGGVDSVVLLDLLSKQQDITLHVAHYDHGIRPDSSEDALLVKALAAKHGLPFYSKAGKLGPKASEALAREKRYAFLRDIQRQLSADAIVTAHHQDDWIETAILNQLRGTGRRGLSSLKTTDDIIRPLLGISKQELRDYAGQHHLQWREDSTNVDERYARNYVRRHITPKLSSTGHTELVNLINNAATQNKIIDELLQEVVAPHVTAKGLNRQWFISLPHSVAREVLLAWLRQAGIRQLDRRRTEQLVVLAKILPHGKLIDVDAGFQLQVTTQNLALVARER